MEERIFEMIKNIIGIEAVEIQKNTIVSDVMNSISFVQMIIGMEDEFDIEFDDDFLVFSKFQTIDDIIKYVYSKTNN